MRRSAVFGASGWVSFVAGGLGGAVAGSVAGASAVIAGALGGAAGELTRRGLDDRPDRAAEFRHYVLFQPAPDAAVDRRRSPKSSSAVGEAEPLGSDFRAAVRLPSERLNDDISS